jgi:hypothetical protein
MILSVKGTLEKNFCKTLKEISAFLMAVTVSVCTFQSGEVARKRLSLVAW